MGSSATAADEVEQEEDEREERKRKFMQAKFAQQALLGIAITCAKVSKRLADAAGDLPIDVIVTANLLNSQAMLNITKQVPQVFGKAILMGRKPTAVEFRRVPIEKTPEQVAEEQARPADAAAPGQVERTGEPSPDPAAAAIAPEILPPTPARPGPVEELKPAGPSQRVVAAIWAAINRGRGA